MKNLCRIYLQKNILKLGKNAVIKSEEEDDAELGYLIINTFGQMTIGYKCHVCPFEDGNKYAITKIEYGDKKTNSSIQIDEHRLGIYPYIA